MYTATEVAHYSCPSFQLGLVHGGEPSASAALRGGVEGEEALKLFAASSDSHCTRSDADTTALTAQCHHCSSCVQTL